MSLSCKLVALTILFLGSVAVGFCQIDFDGLSGERTYSSNSSSVDGNQVKSEIRQLFEKALKDNEELFGNIQNTVGDMIQRRKTLLEQPKTEGFKGIRFKVWWFIYSTESFKTGEWFKPKEVKDSKNPGIRLLPCRLISDVNKAIEAAYRKGFHHYGYRGTGYSWQTLRCAKVNVGAQNPTTLAKQFKEQEDKVKGVLASAKSFFNSKTGGDKKKVIAKTSKETWKSYITKHEDGLKAMEQIIKQYANAAVEYSNKKNRERFEQAIKNYEQAFGYNSHDFIGVLPGEYRQIIQARLNAAYEEGIADGLEAGITWRRQNTNVGERYTAYWLGRPIMRNCLYRSARATVYGDRIRVAFTVENGSFSNTDYWYPASPMWETGFSVFSFLLDIADTPGCDYGDCGSGSWNDSYTNSGSSTWNDGNYSPSPSHNGSSWNESANSGNSGNTWNDPTPSNPNSGSWNDPSPSSGNTWND